LIDNLFYIHYGATISFLATNFRALTQYNVRSKVNLPTPGAALQLNR